jgi:hypothetical protein
MQGVPLIQYLPLNLNAFERCPNLKEWLLDISSGFGPFEVLEPEGWYTKGHTSGNFIWAPPPAAADVVVEQLSMARHKRPGCFHLVVVPRLMTVYWRKHLARATDMYFRMGHETIWPMKTLHEPVLIFICLPLIPHRPKFVVREELLDQLKRALLGPRLSEAHQGWFRSHLRKLLASARGLLSV